MHYLSKVVWSQSMQILVDADACPVKQIIVRLAKQRNIPVTMLTDTSHQLNDGYSRIITVDKHADSVDYALMGLLAREDVVVTQDYGLAAMVLGNGAQAINQNGLVFTDSNIDRLLLDRHLGQKIRRGGGRTKGPPKRTKDDDARFEAAFARLLPETLGDSGSQLFGILPEDRNISRRKKKTNW
jgi:uncharacterized protein YaiI (UPF0178 family)